MNQFEAIKPIVDVNNNPFVEVTVFPREYKIDQLNGNHQEPVVFSIGNETSKDKETGKDYGIQTMLCKIAGQSILFNAIPNTENGSIDLGVDSYTGSETPQEYFDVVLGIEKKTTSWNPEKGKVESIEFRYVDPSLVTREVKELEFQEA